MFTGVIENIKDGFFIGKKVEKEILGFYVCEKYWKYKILDKYIKRDKKQKDWEEQYTNRQLH